MNTVIILSVSVILLFLFIAAYNKGVVLRNYVREAFSTMDVYLKKRWDLIPNLLETVKGYAAHEQGVLTKVTEIRSMDYASMSPEQKINMNTQLNAGISKLIAVAENYPDLKASQNFSELMKDLSSVENDIANARKYYNGTVREYNNYTEMFPTNITASLFGFKPEKMFEIADSQRQNVKVEM